MIVRLQSHREFAYLSWNSVNEDEQKQEGQGLCFPPLDRVGSTKCLHRNSLAWVGCIRARCDVEGYCDPFGLSTPHLDCLYVRSAQEWGMTPTFLICGVHKTMHRDVTRNSRPKSDAIGDIEYYAVSIVANGANIDCSTARLMSIRAVRNLRIGQIENM